MVLTGRIENGDFNIIESLPNKSSRCSKFESIISNTLNNLNVTTSNNFQTIIKAITNTKEKDIVMNKNNILSVIENLEDGKCKLEDEINYAFDNAIIVKKWAIMEKLDGKIGDLNDAM